MKIFRLRPLVAALLLASTGAAQAADGDASIWSFSGFGTLAAVHSSEREADFVGSNMQPNGAGRTQATSFSPDSKLGGQLSARFTPELSAVLQVMTQHQYDNSWTPQIEWANVQYQFTPALRVRLGRIVMPNNLLSQTRYVGYANPWVRPPQEVYGDSTITSNDGIDSAYVMHFGDAINTVSGFYGTSTAKLPSSSGGKAKANPSWGINNTLEMGATTLRVGFVSTKLDLVGTQVDSLIAGLNGFGAAASAIPVASIQAAGAQSYALAQKYALEGISRQQVSIGASYDPGHWFVMGEFGRFVGKGIFGSANYGYASAGYRYGTWMPYATLAENKMTGRTETGITTTGLPAQLAAGAAMLNAGVNTILASAAAESQKSISLGLRWDFMKNAAAKLQYDHMRLGDNASGQLANKSPSYQPGGTVNLVSVAVDFVF